jgi:hypothetical protein
MYQVRWHTVFWHRSWVVATHVANLRFCSELHVGSVGGLVLSSLAWRRRMFGFRDPM